MNKILFFGIAQDIVGEHEASLNFQDRTVAELRQFLCEKHPDFNQLKSIKFAINEVYANEADLLKANDTIAIIPPVSGG